MALSQEALIGIFVAIMAADIMVIVLALLWSRIQGRRQARPALKAGAASASGRPNGSIGANGGNGNVGNGTYGAANMSIGGRVGAIAPPVDPAIDGLTGLLAPAAWARMVHDEDARVRRYHRAATIVIIELEGLDKLVERMGPGSVERIVPAVADTMRRGAREADHIARLGTGRFAVLMPETDEILAINYVERIRRACELWLEAGAVALHLAIGWASTAGDGHLVDTEATATDRMFTELRRTLRAMTPLEPPVADGGEMRPAPAG